MTAGPGPASQAWLKRLKAVESRNVTAVGSRFPVVWQRAHGCEVWDVDGRCYLDAGSAFGVSLLGHGHPAVVAAATSQLGQLVHGMGDVHPPVARIELLERLVAVAPDGLGHAVLCTGGSEAVEVALKTALLATGKAGALSFSGGYHGLGAGALAVTARADFRTPFLAQLPEQSHFAPFPTRVEELPACLAAVEAKLVEPTNQLGVVVVEPIQGRGGTVVPPPGFLRGLRQLCDAYGALLCCDEIFTGLGRTGVMWACERDGVVPDLLCVGKALGGGFPIAACLGTDEVMAAWPESTGEALHTSTFLGHPVACAAATAALRVIVDEDVPAVAAERGAALSQMLREALVSGPNGALPGLRQVRGDGLMWGIEVHGVDRDGLRSGGALAWEIVQQCLAGGLILLPAGDDGAVLQLTPPAVASEGQLEQMVARLAHAWRRACP